MNVFTMHAQDRQQTAVPPQQARLVKLHPALDAIVSSETAIEKIYAGSGHLLEGPLWTRDGTLLFSDIAANVIYSLRPAGIASVFVNRAGYDGRAPQDGVMAGSNGLTFDLQGRLIVCERGNRRVVRRESNGRVTVLLAVFVPKLRYAGVKEPTIEKILFDDSRRFLAFVPKNV